MNRYAPIHVLVVSSLAAAQSPFLQPVEITATPGTPFALTTGDFTGDGLNDIVTASDRLVLLTSRGSAGFRAPLVLAPDAIDAQALASGDIDGDGDLDIAITDALGSSVSLAWYENPGNGAAMVRRVLNPDIPLGLQLQLADMDGDGDLDYVVYAVPTNSLVWYENSPGMSSPTAMPVAPYLGAEWRIVDVNQDGLADVLFEVTTTAIPASASVALGTSPGSFGAPQALFPGQTNLRSIRLGDVDGDGDLDGILGTSDQLLIAEASGPLTFLAPAPIPSVGTPVFLNVERIDDLNGDGLVDISFTQPTQWIFAQEQVWIAAQPGGVFSAPQPSRTGNDSGQIDALSDVTGDGAPEGLTLAFNGVEVRRNGSGAGTELFGGPQTTSTLSSALADVALIDLELDGDLDILALRAGNNTFAVYVNDGHGGFAEDGLIPFPGLKGEEVWSHDFDLDGDDDLLLLKRSQATDGLVILRNEGARSFQEVVLYSPSMARVTDPQVDDVDGDGDLDVVFASGGGVDSLRWLRNDGPSLSFTELLLDMPTGTTVGDVDDDGQPDLVCVRPATSTQSETVTWRRNIGGGDFAAETFLVDAFQESAVTLADVGGDGSTDILVNQDNPIFVASAITAGSQYAPLAPLGVFYAEPGRRLLAEDFNADGLVDLVGYQDFSFGRVWINPGSGPTVDPTPIFPQVGASDTPRFGDVDGDGDLDAVAVSFRQIWIATNGTVSPLGTNVCGPANFNSSNRPARMGAQGSLDPVSTNVTLIADDMPVNVTGIFLVSRTVGTPQPLAGSQGALCLNGAVGRFSLPMEIRNSGAGGSMRLELDLTFLPEGNGRVPAMPGETWSFQAWFRDTVSPAVATSNLTDAISLTF